MSFRLPLPDGRNNKDEEQTPSRLAAHRSAARVSPTPRDSALMAGDSKLEGSLPLDSTSHAPSPGPDRRHVVFPDPVAFR